MGEGYAEQVLDALVWEDEWAEPDGLWWNHHLRRFLVNCNDLFYWACSDCETIELEDLEILRGAINDTYNAGVDEHAFRLFAARKRKMRPQRLQDFPGAARKLYEACGPERTTADEG